MDFNPEKAAGSPLLIIDREAVPNADFMAKLARETQLETRHFRCLKSALNADMACVIIADIKTIGTSEAIETLYARFAAPIIILADRPSLALAVNAMRAGASDFFPKPASASAIGGRIRGILAKSTISSRKIVGSQGIARIVPFWEQERDIIESAVDACHGNISHAAAALQISPSTIYRKKQLWEDRLGQ